MRNLILFAAIVTVFALAASAQQTGSGVIQGQYVETRSADVYTGQCFANGEVGLTGDEAIVAWHVQKGEWDGVPLAGLTVAGAIKARATLGDPYANPLPAKSVIFIDSKATPAQRQALINFAQEMGGQLLRHVVKVVDTNVDMEILSAKQGAMDHSARARLQAGDFVKVETRPIGDKDHLCGNEATYYPPLTETAHAMPAVAMTDSYSGNDLGTSWELHDKRSAFVGTFSR